MKNILNITQNQRLSIAFLLTAILALGVLITPSAAFTSADADTIFNAYFRAFYKTNGGKGCFTNSTSGGVQGFWTTANQIEMVADAYDRNKNPQTSQMLSALCYGFVGYHKEDWSSNKYNDDIIWAVIAFSRAYIITGNSYFRDIAKRNFDTVWKRGWDITHFGGGIWWTTDANTKNACVNGPATIAATYLSQILKDNSYLTKAKQIYAWQRATLFNTQTGAVADSINKEKTNWDWLFSYNSGTMVGAANALYKLTGQRSYFDDAVLATRFTRGKICDKDGIFPQNGGTDVGDGAGFNGIGIRWIAKFVKDQKLDTEFYPWLRANAEIAWNNRRASDNLSWCNWRTQTPVGERNSFGCFGSVTTLQVIPPTGALRKNLTVS